MNQLMDKDAICQVGLLVRDLEATGKKYAEFFGVEVPPVVFSGAPEVVKAEYNGLPSDATCRMMFFMFGNLQLELIEPDQTASVWHDDLLKKGEGLHHLAFQVKNSKAKAAELAQAGYPVRMMGDYGDNSGCFHYMDVSDALKMTIELLESY